MKLLEKLCAFIVNIKQASFILFKLIICGDIQGNNGSPKLKQNKNNRQRKSAVLLLTKLN